MTATSSAEQLLEGLNPHQREAVSHTDGPLLILAGPGSGKTRVIVHRVAYLLRTVPNLYPYNVLAVTFTNKAARELRERLDTLVGADLARGLSVGTFHSLAARWLRRDIKHLGRDPGFAIYDDNDQLDLIKQILKELEIDEKRTSPRSVLSAISHAKSELIDPDAYTRDAQGQWHETVARVYGRYNDLLDRHHALDFDDLLGVTVELFRTLPEVLDFYQRRFRYVMVDEFQDTNIAQYEIVKLLTNKNRNLCVVGDEDQCLPSGSPINVDGGTRPIEEIETGATVLAGAGRGTASLSPVLGTRARPYAGELVQITLRSGRVVRLTPNHMCFARLGLRRDVHFVYLMFRRDMGYRIGIVVGARVGNRGLVANGLAVRANQEHADKMWILRVCETRQEAAYFEQFYSTEYGIPTMVFFAAGRGDLIFSQQTIDKLFSSIDTRTHAERLMRDLQLNSGYPHHRPQGITDHGFFDRKVVHLTAFGGRSPSSQTPWYHHRVWLNTTSKILQDQVEHAGVATRPGARGTWRVEKAYRDLVRTVDMSERIAEAADADEVAKWAVLTEGSKFGFQPAAHLRTSMIVPVIDGGRVVEDEIVDVTRVAYDGVVHDIDVADLHNYAVNGMLVHNSIYSWRSADIRNILNFENDFPDLKVVVLEQNYRSTSTILKVARAVIASNKMRKDKNLWTHNDQGLPVTVHEAYNEQDEALYVLREIERLHRSQHIPLSHFGILYRTNAQSRAIEDAFVRAGMPYRLVGGVRFYERREVKDVLAYLRLIHNPFDTVSLQRVINLPPRGIGQKTVQDLLRWSGAENLSPYEALVRIAALRTDDSDVLAAQAPFPARARELLGAFADIVEPIRQDLAERSVLDVLDAALERSGYLRYLRDGTEEGEERWANVQELRSKAQNYDELATGSGLSAFLEDVSLVQDVDQLDESGSAGDAVTLITLHAAKGLEFPYVFLVGVEEGVLPHQRSVDDTHQLEEERRLFYVGITRAMRGLYLVRAFRRTTYGNSATSTASRFLLDIPPSLAMVTHAPGAGSRHPGAAAWSSRREERPQLTRQQARELAARAFQPVAEPRGPSGARPPRPPRPPAEPTYRAGDKVRHPSFGLGIVLSVRVDPSSEIVEVNFAGPAGVKKLDTAFAPLTRA
jgi:DNA helicase-2/ATP-dependent DNA helicase PcrA